jgi:Phosphopantetheine attachment site
MLSDSSITTLITQRHIADSPHTIQGARTLFGRRLEYCRKRKRREFRLGSRAGYPRLYNLYVWFYWHPKGVMITHGGIYNRLSCMQEQYRLGAGDRVLQKTPFSFNVSVWEFFWPLMTRDRKRLPILELQKRDEHQAFVAPRTPLEETFVKIWEEVLSVEEVGIEDNFYELGGHSLLMTKIAAKVRESSMSSSRYKCRSIGRQLPARQTPSTSASHNRIERTISASCWKTWTRCPKRKLTRCS